MNYVQYALNNAYTTWNQQKINFSMCEIKNPRVEKQVENAVSKRSLTSSKCHHTHWPVVHHWSKGGWANKCSLQTVKKFISKKYEEVQRLGALPRSPLFMFLNILNNRILDGAIFFEYTFLHFSAIIIINNNNKYALFIYCFWIYITIIFLSLSTTYAFMILEWKFNL